MKLHKIDLLSRFVTRVLRQNRPPSRDTGSINKIFIIGFNKTATRALNHLFEANGIPSIHWDEGKLAVKMVQNACSGRKILDGYDHRYKVFSDMAHLTDRICIEGNSFYRILDRDYPQSVFIYNTRKEDDWVRSRLNHDSGAFLRNFQQILKPASVEKVVAHWKETRQRHELGLFRYFAGRSDLLVFDIDQMLPDAICAFLGIELDTTKYKWVGKTAYAEAKCESVHRSDPKTAGSLAEPVSPAVQPAAANGICGTAYQKP